MSVEYRPISTRDEIEQAVRIQDLIWNADASDALPYHLLIALQHVGGLVLGAFDGKQLIGILVSFLGLREGAILNWNHFTGVLPTYQGRGIGRELKWLLRRLVLEQGYNCAAWTYDPLRRALASFNLRHLGCICNQYHVDFYGEMRDGLNRGLLSDRFEVRWWLESKRVLQRLHVGPSVPTIDGVHCALSKLENGNPSELAWPAMVEKTLVEIPEDIGRLKKTRPDLAMRWRLHTREVFTKLFNDGFTAIDFVSRQEGNERRSWYILQRDVEI